MRNGSSSLGVSFRCPGSEYTFFALPALAEAEEAFLEADFLDDVAVFFLDLDGVAFLDLVGLDDLEDFLEGAVFLVVDGADLALDLAEEAEEEEEEEEEEGLALGGAVGFCVEHRSEHN